MWTSEAWQSKQGRSAHSPHSVATPSSLCSPSEAAVTSQPGPGTGELGLAMGTHGFLGAALASPRPHFAGESPEAKGEAPCPGPPRVRVRSRICPRRPAPEPAVSADWLPLLPPTAGPAGWPSTHPHSLPCQLPCALDCLPATSSPVSRARSCSLGAQAMVRR